MGVFTFIAITLSGFLCFAGLEITLRLSNASHITPGFLKTHPERRYELRPNFAGKTYDVPFITNSHGLRDFERNISTGDDAYRIGIYGDSLTMGVGVNMTDTYPKVLETTLNEWSQTPIQVFNFGVNGYNTVMEHIYIKDSYAEFKPHMIIIELAVGGDTVLTTPPGSFEQSNKYSILRALKDLLRYTHSYHWLSAKYHNFMFNLDSKGRKTSSENAKFWDTRVLFDDHYQGWIEAQQAYKNIFEFCKEKNITLMFVLYASTKKFSPKLEEDFFYPAIQKVAEAVSSSNIKNTILIDDIFRPYFKNKEILWVKPKDYHLSTFAHKLVGQKLFDYITEKKLITFDDFFPNL